MVFPALSLMSRRGLAQGFIRSGVTRGFTGAAIIRTLRESGITYRRTNMLEDIRIFRGVEVVKPALQSIRLDFYPSERMYRSPQRFMIREYGYDVKMRFFDPRSEEIRQQFTRVSSDVPLTRGQIEQTAKDYFRPPSDEYEFTDLAAILDSAFHRPEVEQMWIE